MRGGGDDERERTLRVDKPRSLICNSFLRDNEYKMKLYLV